MKNLILILFVCLHAFAISQDNVSWCRAAGDEGIINYVDAAGNNYFGGKFQGTEDFDPGSGIHNLTSNGLNDCFLVKLDNQGNFLWAISFGGSNYDNLYGIKTDAAGNVFLTGAFQETVDFDSGAGIFNLVSVATSDIYVLKLNAAGDFLWAVQFGSSYYNVAFDMAAASDGGVVLTGHYYDTIDFDPGSGVHEESSVSSASSAFLLKLDEDGDFVWVKTFSGIQAVQGYNVNVDVFGNVILSGNFLGTVDFDPGVGVYLLSSSENIIFMLKLDANGDFLWANQLNTAHIATPSLETIVAPDGSVYLSGGYTDSIDLDPGPGTATFNSNGNRDVFVARYDPDGSLVWGGSFGGIDNDEVGGIAMDASDELLLTGRLFSDVDFDIGSGTHIEPALGQGKMYLLSMTSAGDFNSVKIMSSTLSIEPRALFAVSADELYITGTFSGMADFDPGFDQYLLSPVDTYDAFQLKLGCTSAAVVVENGFELSATANLVDYQWVDCSNAFATIAGETNQTFNAIENGEYAVIVSQNGCADTSACITLSDIGSADYSSTDISIFPNPTSGKVIVNCSHNAQLKVYAMSGEEVYSSVLFIGSNNLDFTNLAEGVYTIQVTNDTHQSIHQFVIAR